MKFAPCPDHPGCNIANHACEECGHPQADPKECWPLVTRWPGVEERPMPGQLVMTTQPQLELYL